MNKILAGIALSILLFAAMSCSLIDRFKPGNENWNRASELWNDVPAGRRISTPS